MGKKKHIIQLREFKKKLSKNIQVKKMILFGSRAYGKPGRWSDFDLIIVSPNFRRKDGVRERWDFINIGI